MERDAPASILDQIAELAATPHVGDLLAGRVKGVLRPKSVRPVKANWQQVMEQAPTRALSFRSDIECHGK